MNEPPVVKLDPEKLRAERHDVDLGDAETGFDQARRGEIDSAQPPSLTEPTAGVIPPAR